MAHECLEKRGITDKRPRRASFLGKQISESTEAAVVPPGEFDRRAKPSLTFADLSDTSPFPGHHRACGSRLVESACVDCGDDDVLDFLVGHFVDVDLTGNQRRNRPLAFSTPPFCQEA